MMLLPCIRVGVKITGRSARASGGSTSDGMEQGRLHHRPPVVPPTRRLAFIPEPVEPEEPPAPTTPRCSWRVAPPPPPPADAAGRAPMSERQQLALLLQLTSPAAPSTPSSGEGSPATPCGATPAQRRLHKRNERGETPLQVASIRGDLRRVRRLIADGADVNAADFAGRWPTEWGGVPPAAYSEQTPNWAGLSSDSRRAYIQSIFSRSIFVAILL
ncbi:Ankyrin repeat domain-containing protein 11 [Amphibalanus amphitrite]|uniref:Ankyrin repeat domain-containing protein 11 n=1 Tax=Amphibalanus amphitrite TaxID=1232801 RepID=A0A6A4X9N0_AMPAM|nr:Ankyrin repeat domain-containing protein 11 [Amphibalanus amphitrite]